MPFVAVRFNDGPQVLVSTGPRIPPPGLVAPMKSPLRTSSTPAPSHHFQQPNPAVPNSQGKNAARSPSPQGFGVGSGDEVHFHVPAAVHLSKNTTDHVFVQQSRAPRPPTAPESTLRKVKSERLEAEEAHGVCGRAESRWVRDVAGVEKQSWGIKSGHGRNVKTSCRLVGGGAGAWRRARRGVATSVRLGWGGND
uniref:Uncharacterized protein n=1 Tax=Mycena chlorophos TaxID=658473 RepID=A0ABQ0KVC1_MYCCL|nr:predicted protein [Mycena chlorophos]